MEPLLGRAEPPDLCENRPEGSGACYYTSEYGRSWIFLCTRGSPKTNSSSEEAGLAAKIGELSLSAGRTGTGNSYQWRKGTVFEQVTPVLQGQVRTASLAIVQDTEEFSGHG